MKQVFVTGGTGFVGSHLVEWILARGNASVRCLARRGPRWLEGLEVDLVEGDLSDEDVLAQGAAQADIVYHNAGVTRAQDPEVFEEANVRGTERLLSALARRTTPPDRILITSSLAAVGRADVRVATESTPLNPISLYGASKARMEAVITKWKDRLPITVVRPPAVYGPRDSDILTFFQAAAKGVCPVVGSGTDPAVTLVYVGDLVRGMVMAAEAPEAEGQAYFIGTSEPVSWNAVRDATAAALNRRVITLPIPRALVVPIGSVAETVGGWFGRYPALNREKALEIRDACTMCSSERAGRDFGYRDRIDLASGVALTIEWYKGEGWL